MNITVNKTNKNLILKKLLNRGTLFILSILLFFAGSALASPHQIETGYMEDLLKAKEAFSKGNFYEVIRTATT
jgi:hypothetical protein